MLPSCLLVKLTCQVQAKLCCALQPDRTYKLAKVHKRGRADVLGHEVRGIPLSFNSIEVHDALRFLLLEPQQSGMDVP